MTSFIENATLETLKEWYEAGAPGKEDRDKTKKRLKTLLNIDPNPTIGETLKTRYTSSEPALIFKQGKFEARIRLGLVEHYLQKNWYTPRTPKEWLKENLIGGQGKVLLSQKELCLIDSLDIGLWASDGNSAIKVATKAQVPSEIKALRDISESLKNHLKQGNPFATVDTKNLYSHVKLFSKSDTLELEVTPGSLAIRAFKGDTLEGSSILPAQCYKPCTVKVNTKVFNALARYYPLNEITLGDNGSCTTLDDQAVLYHFKGYPLSTNA